MFELCPYTGLAYPIDSSEHVNDFIITATNDDGIEILALTKDANSTFLKVFDFPSKLQAFAWDIVYKFETFSVYRYEL